MEQKKAEREMTEKEVWEVIWCVKSGMMQIFDKLYWDKS